MAGRVDEVLIVGGGTAGWLTACYLARTLNIMAPGSIQVELVESADIGIIGVGEGTTEMFPRILFGTLGLNPRRFYEVAEPQ